MLDTTRVEAELARARAYADEQGLRLQLEEQLRYLDTYAEEENDRGGSRCMLFPDFAPHSFGFTLEVKNGAGEYRRWFSGGLIFHGRGGGNGAAPEYSVSLSPEVGWQVHT